LLVVGYWLLVIGYWLLVIGYWLLGGETPPLHNDCLLPTAYCPLEADD